MYAALIFAALLFAIVANRSAPQPFALGFVLLVVGGISTLLRPVIGIYIVAFFAVLGDAVTSPWYPFVKNFSSRESILYVNDQLVVSPLEVFLFLAFVGWLLGMVGSRRVRLYRAPVLRPLVALTCFVVLGLAWGLAHGGDSNVALWEARPLLQMAVLLVLVVNVCDRTSHYTRIFGLVCTAVFLDSLLAIRFYENLPLVKREDLESLGEHSASLHVNLLLVLLAATYLYRNSSRARRVMLPVVCAPCVYAYFLAQRRAAIVGLVVAAIVLAAVLFYQNRRAFWYIVPLATVLAVVYVGAFWNSQSSAGFPAQAIKGVVAPSQLSAADQSSDLYRKTEAFDLVYTIRSNPLLGVGFGQKFLRPVPLPDISFFVWWEYMPHNSILWLWLKLGVLGFIAFFYFVATLIKSAVGNLVASSRGEYGALMLASVLFVVMFLVYAYVDIAWESQSLVLLAITAGFIGRVDLPQAEATSASVEAPREVVAP